MTKKRKVPARIRLSAISIWDQMPGWAFMKNLHCVRSVSFGNGSALVTGTIPSHGKRK